MVMAMEDANVARTEEEAEEAQEVTPPPAADAPPAVANQEAVTSGGEARSVESFLWKVDK